MKHFVIIVSFILISISTLFSQKPETVLFSIGDENVMLSEFQYIYEKNNKNDSNFYKIASLKEYLDLFVNFKLKVKEARSMGLDTSQSFKKEFLTYRDQLTKPYMTDKATIENLMKEAYSRLQWEIRASHILIRLSEDASEAETAKALATINEVYKKAAKGEDFSELAAKYSQDPSVKYNKGDLGYFSAFHLIYSFENVAYNTPVGKVSKPFRTEFGYHILKVTDRRPYQGTVKIGMIFIKAGDSVQSKSLIDSIYAKLKNGGLFDELARTYSQDERSKMNGGDMPEFNSFSYNVPFEIKEQAFKLKNIGDYSAPFKTDAGWYIIIKKGWKGLSTYEEMQNYLKTKVSKDSRSQLSKENAIANMKTTYHFKEKKGALDVFYQNVDTSITSGSWKIKDKSVYSLPLFYIGKETITQLEFAKYIENQQVRQHYTNPKYAVQQFYNEFVNETVIDYADRHLEETYPEFRNLVNEYEEGMLLFEIMDKQVWTKAMNDSAGQHQYFEKNISNYQWDQRIDAEIFSCRNGVVAMRVDSMLKAGKASEDIVSSLNKENAMNVSFQKGKFEKNKDMAYLDGYFSKTGTFIITDPGKETVKVLNVKSVLPEGPKKFDEIKGIVIADYQNYLDKEWIGMLKAKYPVKINEAVLNSIAR